MKKLVLLAAIFAGSAASAKVCHDYWGNSVSVNVTAASISVGSSRYPSSTMRRNGESSSSYYYRNQTGSLAIVAKSVLSSGSGKVVYQYPVSGGKSDRSRRVNLSCN